MTVLEKVMQDTGKSKKELLEDHCPDDFGYKDIDSDICTWGYDRTCEECWNRELTEEELL